MNMKIMKKLIFVMVMLLFGSFFTTVQANFGNRSLMFESSFHLYVNGEFTILRDDSGNIIQPVMIYDTIYLPLRAISEVLAPDKQVQWDNNTNTAIIGERPSNLTPSSFRYVPIQVAINGNLVQLNDSPILMNDILFIALSDIRSIFGLTGQWEFLTSSIIIGTRPERFIVRALDEDRGNAQEFSIFMDDFTEWQLQEFYAHPRGVARNFTGISLQSIFENLGISIENAVGVSFRAEDGFSVMIPWDEAMDSQNTFIAIKEDGELFGTRQEGGSGPFRSVIALDPFANRWCRYLLIIEIIQ